MIANYAVYFFILPYIAESCRKLPKVETASGAIRYLFPL